MQEWVECKQNGFPANDCWCWVAWKLICSTYDTKTDKREAFSESKGMSFSYYDSTEKIFSFPAMQSTPDVPIDGIFTYMDDDNRSSRNEWQLIRTIHNDIFIDDLEIVAYHELPEEFWRE